jgi:hypothetical protein
VSFDNLILPQIAIKQSWLRVLYKVFLFHLANGIEEIPTMEADV